MLHNWKRELDLWCPNLRTILYTGQNERLAMQHKLKNYDVVVATYTMFERASGSDDRAEFRRIRWNLLVCDEGHSIKNAASSRKLVFVPRCFHLDLLNHIIDSYFTPTLTPTLTPTPTPTSNFQHRHEKSKKTSCQLPRHSHGNSSSERSSRTSCDARVFDAQNI